MAFYTTDIYRKKSGEAARPNRNALGSDNPDSKKPEQTAPAKTGRKSPAAQAVYYLLDILEILLAFRLVFRLVGANAGNAFVNFIYSITDPFVSPFRNIVPPTTAGGILVDWSVIIAMIVYAIAAYILAKLFSLLN